MPRNVIPYLQRRGDTYYFRCAVPRHLRSVFKRGEITYSLRTKDKWEAQKRSRQFITICEEFFVRIGQMSTAPDAKAIKEALRKYFEEHLRQTTTGIRFNNPSDQEEAVEIAQSDYWSALESLTAPVYASEEKEVAELISNSGWNEEGVNQLTRDEILDGIREAQAESLRILLAKLKGKDENEITPQGRFKPEAVQTANVETYTNLPPTAKAITLDDFITKYCDKQEEDEWWDVKTRPNHESDLRLFAAFVGKDKKMHEITADDVIKYEALLRKKPKNFSKAKRYRNKSLEEAVAMAKESEWITAQTASKHYANVNQLFDSAQIDFRCIKANPVPAKLRRRIKIKKKKRLPYSKEQLEKWFGSARFNRADGFKKSFKFWFPLILLFSGGRSAEISMLRLKDIRKDPETGIYYFDITPYEYRRLKNTPSVRKVPIHPFLIRQGFLEYVKDLKRKKEHMLFPENMGAKSPSDSAGKKIRRERDELKIKLKEKDQGQYMLDIHSFRGNFTDALRNAGVVVEHRDLLTGRTVRNPETAKESIDSSYGENNPMRLKYECICKVKYPLDWEKLLKPAAPPKRGRKKTVTPRVRRAPAPLPESE